MKESIHDLIFKNFLKLFTGLIIIVGFIYVIYPFMIPLIFGGMLAMAFSPMVQKLMGKGYSRKKALWVLTAVLFVAVILPLTFFFLRGFQVVSHFFSEQSFSELTKAGQVRVYELLDKINQVTGIDPSIVREKIVGFIGNAGNIVLKLFGSIVAQIPDIVILSIITLFAFYFFLAKEVQIRKFFDRYFHFSQKNADAFIIVFKSSCREVFFANVITGLLQSSIVAIGALIVGIGDFYIVFFITFIISFIPVIGAAPMAFLLAIYAFIDDRFGAGVTMAIVGTVSGVADNIIRPYLTSSFGKSEVPIFVAFVAVIGGVVTMGIPGLFVGPLLASLVYGALPIIGREYFPELKEHEHLKTTPS